MPYFWNSPSWIGSCQSDCRLQIYFSIRLPFKIRYPSNPKGSKTIINPLHTWGLVGFISSLIDSLPIRLTFNPKLSWSSQHFLYQFFSLLVWVDNLLSICSPDKKFKTSASRRYTFYVERYFLVYSYYLFKNLSGLSDRRKTVWIIVGIMAFNDCCRELFCVLLGMGIPHAFSVQKLVKTRYKDHHCLSR